MQGQSEAIETQVQNIADSARAIGYPDGFDRCLLAASMLIENAGDILAAHEQGNRVSELMLLSARIEGLMKTPLSE